MPTPGLKSVGQKMTAITGTSMVAAAVVIAALARPAGRKRARADPPSLMRITPRQNGLAGFSSPMICNGGREPEDG